MEYIANNQNIGKIGEDLACKYLINKKYKILFRNYREKFDEIDIIAKSFDGNLVFVEVKTLKMNEHSKLMPEDNLTKNKFKKISRACRIFAGNHTELISDQKGWRMDLVAITLNERGDTSITHYENIAE
ncbi:MAG: YraN family protein [Minisyncoccia bacterium]